MHFFLGEAPVASQVRVQVRVWVFPSSIFQSFGWSLSGPVSCRSSLRVACAPGVVNPLTGATYSTSPLWTRKWSSV